MSSQKTNHPIGKSAPRKEGRKKVTGQALYVDDISFPEMLYGTTVRSPVARGRIKGIHFEGDIPWSEFTIVTAKDIPGENFVALILNDQPYLADEVVNHPEEPVVLLAHKDKHLLEEARRNVRLEIDPLPAIFTLEDALNKTEIIWGNDNVFTSYLVDKGNVDDNIFKKFLVDKGNVDEIWAGAHLVIEGEYFTGAQEQLYIENNGVIAIANEAEGVTVWGSMQCPYYVHKALLKLFGLTEEKIRVIQTETGGGFGGKEEYPSLIAGHAALLSWKSGKPVKIVYDRAEDMVATTKRHPSRTRHWTAVSKEGKLLAQEIEFVIDGGAYCTLSPVVLSRGTIHAAGPYFCPNVRIRSLAVATNAPPHGAFRGFGAPQSIFALERQMDKVAYAVGLSPEEFRRRNFIHQNETTATGQVIHEQVELGQLLDRAFALTDYTAKRERFARENAGLEVGIAPRGEFLHKVGGQGPPPNNPSDSGLRIFLCHASGDKPVVRDLYQRLRADGFNPWLDEEDLLPGQDWAQEISKAVRESDAVVVCLSREASTKRGYVQKEIKFALEIADEQPEGDIFIIPLRLEDCDVPTRLQRLQWADLFAKHGYGRLVRSLSVRRTQSGKSASLGSPERDASDQEMPLKADHPKNHSSGSSPTVREGLDRSTSRIKKGIGFASFMHGAGFTGSGEVYLASVVGAEATAEGRVRILAASTEIGQGTNTIFSQIAAEALGVDGNLIEVAQPDTSNVPNSGPTVASRTCMVVGKLVESAVLGLKQTLIGSGLLKEVYSQAEFQNACREYTGTFGPLKAFSKYQPPPNVYWDDEKYQGDAYGTYAWAVYVAEVSVDLLTYEAHVDDFVAVQEVGRVINPVLAAGQIEGGVAQAIGFTLFENVVWKDGRMANGQMTNYIMPTAADIPPIRVYFEENPYAYGPGGAKGIGELPMDGAAPAILSAIENATGVSFNHVPLMPEAMMEALASKSI